MATVMKLGRCPHCDGLPGVHKASGIAGGDVWWIECDECGAKTDKSFDLDNAAEKWNRRADAGFKCPKDKNGKPVRLGDVVRSACTGMVGQVTSIEFARLGEVRVNFGNAKSRECARPEHVERYASELVAAMLSLDSDMQLTPEGYCSEVLEHGDTSHLLPLAAIELKMRDVKQRLDGLEAMECTN